MEFVKLKLWIMGNQCCKQSQVDPEYNNLEPEGMY